jgi:hypothetical protein
MHSVEQAPDLQVDLAVSPAEVAQLLASDDVVLRPDQIPLLG